MVIEIETGHFTKDNTDVDGATQVVTTGFTPKALMLYGSPLTLVVDETVEGNMNFSMGFSDGTNHACSSLQMKDADGTGEAADGVRNDAAYAIQSIANGTGAITSRCSVAFGANKFTLTWDVNDTFASIIHYIIWGGDDLTDVEVRNFQSATVTGVQNVATSINTADVVFIVGSDTATINVLATHMSQCFGVATSTTKRWVSSWGAKDNQAKSNHFEGFNSDEVLVTKGRSSGAVIENEADFAGFTSSGFDLDYTIASATTKECFYLTMKGGQWEAGNGSAKITSAGNKPFTTGFQPEGLVMCGVERTTEGSAREDFSPFISGISSTTTEELAGFFGKDNKATEDVGRMSSITDCFRISDQTATKLSEAELNAFNDTDFTLNFTTVDANAYLFGFVVMRSDAVAVDEFGGPAGSSKTKAKGVSLIDMQEVAYKKKPQVLGNKKLIHPHAELKMIAKFKTPVEGHIRYESRFKIPLKGLQMKSTFAKKVAARIESRSKFKVKQKIKLEHYSRFDYSKLIETLKIIKEYLDDEPKLEFRFKELSTAWEQDDDREKSFDEPSTVIGRVIYTPDLQTMEIELPGMIYNYCNVPERIFDAFKGAGSKGAFYNREIKNIFTC